MSYFPLALDTRLSETGPEFVPTVADTVCYRSQPEYCRIVSGTPFNDIRALKTHVRECRRRFGKRG